MPATLYYTPTSCGAATYIAAFKAGLLESGKVRRETRVRATRVAVRECRECAPATHCRAAPPQVVAHEVDIGKKVIREWRRRLGAAMASVLRRRNPPTLLPPATLSLPLQ